MIVKLIFYDNRHHDKIYYNVTKFEIIDDTLFLEQTTDYKVAYFMLQINQIKVEN